MTEIVRKFELSPQFCFFNGAAVLSQSEDCVRVGLLNTEDEMLKERIVRSVQAFFETAGVCCEFDRITGDELEKIVSRNYGASDSSSKSKIGNRQSGKIPEGGEKDEPGGKNAAVVLLDSLLSEAVNKGVSDIHIEEKKVRFRHLGRLVFECELDSSKSVELVRRIKVLSKMDVLEDRRGQEGQFVFNGCGVPVFVRVSCIPVISCCQKEKAESMVLRLLNPQKIPLALDKLGFSAKQMKLIDEFLLEKNGIVLICGPTGAGKSTTAAAMLKTLHKKLGDTRKIITVEDPPEYVLEGITQIKVDEKFSLDFGEALRLIFRHDPDVIFVGEIRDEKTLATALRACQTGHLVFATVHTGGFFETVTRMCDLGADMTVLCSCLRGIVLQSLEPAEKENSFSDVVLNAKVLKVDKNTARNIINSKGMCFFDDAKEMAV